MDSTAEIHTAREGDQVVARDGALGQVDRIVRSDSGGPVYFVVSVGPILRRRYPVLHRTLVTGVDRRRAKVYVRGRRRLLERLPESPPIVI
jgi:hypothetical protein